MILLDAVHLVPARRTAAKLGCEVVVADLTGGTRPHGDRVLANYATDPTVDLVISANVLSQLQFGVSDTASHQVAEDHLVDLRDFAAPVCLLTDVGYRDVGADGAVIQRHTLVDPDLLPGVPDAEWDWIVAPKGEISRRFSRIHRVEAWRDINAARADSPNGR